MSHQNQRLFAYEIHPQEDMPVEPAPHDRDWMDSTDRRFAYRCLPLVVANQAGWIVRSPCAVQATWNGGQGLGDLQVTYPDGQVDNRVMSHFGSGVLTFTLPYLFRTPEGINLWVKGPANHIKDGVQPLEGIVESDWAESTFTMNWKVTRTGQTIAFARGEPICMLVPLPRDLALSLDPIRTPLERNTELKKRFEQWSASRQQFNTGLAMGDPEAVKLGWQRDYMLGRTGAGEQFAGHQTKLQLQSFRREA